MAMSGAAESSSCCVATTQYGQVKGNSIQVRIKCRSDEEYSVPVHEFLGIPYATQPTGNRRFKPLDPLEPWNGILDATHFKSAPIQARSNPILGSSIKSEAEECAYLNIWKPVQISSEETTNFAQLRRSLFSPLSRRKSGAAFEKDSLPQAELKKLYRSCDALQLVGKLERPRRRTLTSDSEDDPNLVPVFVFLYGGGFHNGASSESLYHGQVLCANQSVVVVTLDYRLGVLGFLHIPDVVEPNLGLKDQLVALKWIKDNIDSFGGDPNNITLAGHSSGASSVFCHYLSAQSRNYFHKAVAMSGSYDSLWAVGRSKSSLISHSKRFVSQNGGSVKQSPDEILAFLQSLPLMCFSILLDRHFLPFGPIEDSSFFSMNNTDAFIDNKDIPLLATLTRHEGDFFTWFVLREKVSELLTDSPEAYTSFIKQYLHGFLPDEAIEQVEEFYQKLPIQKSKIEVFQKVSEMMGDIVINLSLVKFLNDICFNFPKSPIYMAVHDFRPNLAHSTGLSVQIPEYVRCSHGSDLLHVFGHNMQRCSEEELVMIHSLQECIREFMKYGAPIDADQLWPKFTKEHQVFVYITPYNLEISENFRSDFVNFWEKL